MCFCNHKSVITKIRICGNIVCLVPGCSKFGIPVVPHILITGISDVRKSEIRNFETWGNHEFRKSGNHEVRFSANRHFGIVGDPNSGNQRFHKSCSSDLRGWRPSAAVLLCVHICIFSSAPASYTAWWHPPITTRTNAMVAISWAERTLIASMQALARWRHAANSNGVHNVSMSRSMAKNTKISFRAIFA